MKFVFTALLILPLSASASPISHISPGAQLLVKAGIRTAETMGGARAIIEDGFAKYEGNFSGDLGGGFTVFLKNGASCEVAYMADELAPEVSPLKDADLHVACSNGKARWVYRSKYNR